MFVIWIVLPCLLFAGTRAEQQCHVCVPGSGSVEVEQLFPGSTLHNCKDATDIKVCPENFKGCLTQFKGQHVTRTCAQLAVNVCRSVNGVEYCYCSGQLCNAPVVSSTMTITDDEDLAEGSGMESENRQITSDPNTTPPLPSPTFPSAIESGSVTLLVPYTLCIVLISVVTVWR